MNLNNEKIVVAIENEVCNQLEASGITADPFRLDGEKIIDVILQQIEGFVLVSKELGDVLADELASDAFNNIQSLFDYEHRGSTVIEREQFRLKWCGYKAKEFQEIYKHLIAAQEQK